MGGGRELNGVGASVEVSVGISVVGLVVVGKIVVGLSVQVAGKDGECQMHHFLEYVREINPQHGELRSYGTT